MLLNFEIITAFLYKRLLIYPVEKLFFYQIYRILSCSEER